MAACNIDIKQYVGKTISNICSNGYHKSSDNHCAHFVSHILGFRFGFKCRGMTGKGSKSDAANIRVQEVFSKCPTVTTWNNKPAAANYCLAFITSAGNVNLKTKRMRNHPRKHIGVYLNGLIFHYSNSKNKVVSQIPKAFSKHYSGRDITIYYGAMPI